MNLKTCLDENINRVGNYFQCQSGSTYASFFETNAIQLCGVLWVISLCMKHIRFIEKFSFQTTINDHWANCIILIASCPNTGIYRTNSEHSTPIRLVLHREKNEDLEDFSR